MSSPNINFSVVNKCRKALSSLAGQFHFFIIWVPGHRNIFGNEQADELVKSGASLEEFKAKVIIPSPLRTIKIELNTKIEQRAQNK